jgi:hypothetical protein
VSDAKHDINTEIRDALAKMLLDLLTNGIIVRDADGTILKDKDGQPLREPPNASYLAVARAFVKDHPGTLPISGKLRGVLKEYEGAARAGLPFDTPH